MVFIHNVPFVIEPREELIYRGEGNSSLVVALQSKRKVIRLLKSHAKKLQKNDEDVRSLLLQHIDFNKNILPETLPLCFFSPPTLICLDPAELKRICHLVEDKRPSFRLDKTISNCDFALLMPDYCCIPKSISASAFATGPTLSIEIKPKQGFLPLAALLTASDPSLSIKSKICRFGLSQFYKLQKQSISKVSSYCPLNLFSGCRTRALDALYGLIDNPQNNFRVFCDAQLVYGDHFYGKPGCLENLQEILCTFLSLEAPQQTRNGYVNGNGKQTNGHCNDKEMTSIMKGCTNRRTNGCLANGNEHQKQQQHRPLTAVPPVLASFCKLLLDSLYDDKFQETSQYKEHKSSQFSIVHEFEKVQQVCNEPRFLRTFMQMFDENLAPQPTPPVDPLTPSDINNNQINGNAPFALFTNGHPLGNSNHKRYSNVPKNNNGNNKVPNGVISGEGHAGTPLCCFHQRSQCCPESPYSCSKSLPVGCVMDSILQAQKLDSLDSARAVLLYDKLCSEYGHLKESHYPPYSPMIDSFSNEQYNRFIGEFINGNLDDLEKLWRFLISLTAKDCSIMVAIQRAAPNASVLSGRGLIEQGSSVCTLISEESTGQQYVVSISITDLDFKQAYKIERSLHNDRRMIRAFWSALRADPLSFPADLTAKLE